MESPDTMTAYQAAKLVSDYAASLAAEVGYPPTDLGPRERLTKSSAL